MLSMRWDRETLLEVGAGMFVLSFFLGVGLLAGGRLVGGMSRGKGARHQAPATGDLPASSHQHIAVSSPR